MKAANDNEVKPKLPRITSWRGALAWIRKHPDFVDEQPLALRRALLEFYVYWVTDGLQDIKAWELRTDYAELLLLGCKPASPKDFEEECKDRLGYDKDCTDPDDLFDLRGELEEFFGGE